MNYSVTLQASDEGFTAACPELGLTSSGLTTANALDALRTNIQFHIEYCPCSSVDEADIVLDVQ